MIIIHKFIKVKAEHLTIFLISFIKEYKHDIINFFFIKLCIIKAVLSTEIHCVYNIMFVYIIAFIIHFIF